MKVQIVNLTRTLCVNHKIHDNVGVDVDMGVRGSICVVCLSAEVSNWI